MSGHRNLNHGFVINGELGLTSYQCHVDPPWGFLFPSRIAVDAFCEFFGAPGRLHPGASRNKGVGLSAGIRRKRIKRGGVFSLFGCVEVATHRGRDSSCI